MLNSQLFKFIRIYTDIIHKIDIRFWNSSRCILITFCERLLMLRTESLWIRTWNIELV